MSPLLLLALAFAQDAPTETEPTEAPPASEAPADEEPADESASEEEPTEAPADGETTDEESTSEEPDAGEPELPLEEAAEAPDDEADEEIVVYGELALAKARDAVVREMERLGWRSRQRGDGTVVFRGPKGWMGSARFDPELASLDFRRSAVGFRLADYEEPAYTLPPQPTDIGGVANDAPMPSGAGFWLLPRKDKVDGQWKQVRTATADEIAEYQKVLYATAFEEKLQGVATRLDALWSAGVPLEGAGLPVPEDQRLQVIVDYWATRADTREGLRMTKAIEAWIVNDVDGVPEEMQRAAEAKRADSRPFPSFD